MSFDREGLAQALAANGRVQRVVVAATAGSVPREVGAAMLVWPGGQAGTIGGGALEFDAAARARAGETGLRRVPLGPALGQCCGGAVTLLTESWDAEALAALEGTVVARPVTGALSGAGEGHLLRSNSRRRPAPLAGPGDASATPAMPLAVRRLLASARAGGPPPAPALVEGWMVEPVSAPDRQLWLWGAGHVGRALVAVLSPLPGLAITWVDTAADRFPADIPAGVSPLVAADPARAVAHAPASAEHLVLTYSHEIDLALCHALLSHGFAAAGLIGSDTKWARFRARLRQLGHGDAAISRIRCPIGQKSFGKHPQAIALGVASDLLSARRGTAAMKDTA